MMKTAAQSVEVEEMTRTISATEAKARLSSLINWAINNRDEVVVESRGKPKAAILPYESYKQFKELREQDRRRKLLAELEDLAAIVQSRNTDLTDEAAEGLADRFSREVIDEMVEEGKIKYQRD
jgi:prevent-host-death family protein